MKFGRLLACSLMALTLAAPTAYAQDAGEEDLGELTSPRPKKRTTEEENVSPDRTGVYLGFGGSYNIEDFDVGGFGNGFGFNLRAGRRMHPRVALELEIEKFSGFDGTGAEYDAWEMGVNAKGMFFGCNLSHIGKATFKGRGRVLRPKTALPIPTSRAHPF